MFERIESSALSTLLRESESLLAFPGVLILHTLGMALVAGIAAMLCLRLLGVATSIPIPALRPFMPFAWAGLAINVFSGILLVVAYPTKALTNPVFYVKLVLIGASVAALARIGRLLQHPSASNHRVLAGITLLLWMLTITAGRLLPYTYRHLLAGYD